MRQPKKKKEKKKKKGEKLALYKDGASLCRATMATMSL
jgi:hypothetical protein